MHSKKSFLSGIVVGSLIVSSAVATNAVIQKTTSPIIVNGEKIEFNAYNIDGYNYFRIKDLGKELNFSVLWDEEKQQVLIDTSKPYEEQVKIEENIGEVKEEKTEEVIKITQSDAPFRPLTNQVVEAELYKDGKPTGEKTTVKIVKEKTEELPLPTATCDWSQFPELELPTAVIKDYGNGTIGVLNLYETRRMQYTLYNLMGETPTHDAKVSFEFDTAENNIQVMWPYREEELRKVFTACPYGTYRVTAFDNYTNGKFTHTEYYLQMQ